MDTFESSPVDHSDTLRELAESMDSARESVAQFWAAVQWDRPASIIQGAVMGGLFAAALHMYHRLAVAPEMSTAPAVVETEEDPATREARDRLGVDASANADAIRAALRARLATSKLHPDQGGDGKEAALLIAAQNHLLARLRTAEEP